MLKLGTNSVGKMFLGDTEIAKAYLGDGLVYDNTGGAVLPYDAEIEYLQSTGSQYIDTGINPSNNFECEIKAEFTQNQGGFDTLLGSYDGTNYGVALAIQSGGNPYIQFGGGTSYALQSVSPLALRTYKTKLSSGTLTINIDGTAATASFSGSLPSLSLYLYARHKSSNTIGNYTKAKVYYCKIWSGGNLVRDFIPVRVGQVGYMYDRVSGELFENEGSGSFTLGNDITI